MFSKISVSGCAHAAAGTVALGGQGVITGVGANGIQAASTSTDVVTGVLDALYDATIGVNTIMTNATTSINNALNNVLFGDLYEHE